jgi:predicted transcriptional regulator of viral defense system
MVVCPFMACHARRGRSKILKIFYSFYTAITVHTLTDQHPTTIMVLNGKISSVQLEQIWLSSSQVQALEKSIEMTVH